MPRYLPRSVRNWHLRLMIAASGSQSRPTSRLLAAKSVAIAVLDITLPRCGLTEALADQDAVGGDPEHRRECRPRISPWRARAPQCGRRQHTSLESALVEGPALLDDQATSIGQEGISRPLSAQKPPRLPGVSSVDSPSSPLSRLRR